jgi:hypothetical protein
MRLYGTLQELTSLVIRLASGKTVKIQANEQTAAGETQITIPDVVDGADELVLKDTAVIMTNKTLTAPVMTSAQIDSSSKIVLPATASPAQTATGSMVWDSDDLLLTIGKGSGAPKVLVDTDSTQTLSGKTLSGGTVASASITNPTMSGVTINSANRIALSSLTTGVGNNHVLISDANGDLDSEATLAKSRGGAGGDMTNVVFPATGTLVTEDASQTLSNKTLTTPSIAQINTPAQSLAISGTGALTLPAGNNSAQRPGTPANGMIRYNSTDNTFEGYSNGAWAGIGGGGTTDKVTQASHGFVLGDVLYLNGSTYAKAIASAANTAEVVGVVSRVIDASTFEMTLSGEISGLTGLTPGEVYFLSASTAGLLTIVEPSVVGQVSIPVGVASSASTLYVAPKRGVVVGAANARTTISILNNSATSVVSVVDYNSLKLEGELNVTRSSGGNQRAYYTVEAAKNGAGVWQVSASYTGDDVLYTTLPSWDVASNNLQVTMPLVTNFSSASLTYALNAPAVGASLPLSIDSSSLNIVADAPLSYRNRIINGDFEIWQRSASAAPAPNVVTGGYGAADRWKYVGHEGGVTYTAVTMTRVTDAPAGSRYAAKMVSTAAGLDDVCVAQYIEASNCYDLVGQSVTLSFWAKRIGGLNGSSLFVEVLSLATVDTGATGNIYNTTIPPGTTSIQNTTLTNAQFSTSWTKYTMTIPSMPAATANGLMVRFVVDGTDLGSGDLFSLAQVQLEVGSKASAFERRPYGMELQLCQRYYQRGFSGRVANGAYSTTNILFYIPFIVPMRIAALPGLISGASLAGAIDRTGTAGVTPVSVIVGATNSVNGAAINFTCPASSFTLYQPCGLFTDIIEANAEL